MSPKSFAVRIFLQDGTVDGVKIIAKSKWTGRGMVIPRPLLAEEIERKELDAAGVYILVGTGSRDGRPTLVIGSAEPLSRRLLQLDTEADSWGWALVSTAKKGRLDPSTIQYLEGRLLQVVEETKRAVLANPHRVDLPDLDDREREAAEDFFEHLLSICPILDLRVFESL